MRFCSLILLVGVLFSLLADRGDEGGVVCEGIQVVEALLRLLELFYAYLGMDFKTCAPLAIITHPEVLSDSCEGENVGDSVGDAPDGVRVAGQVTDLVRNTGSGLAVLFYFCSC